MGLQGQIKRWNAQAIESLFLVGIVPAEGVVILLDEEDHGVDFRRINGSQEMHVLIGLRIRARAE